MREQELESVSEGNRESLEVLDSALFVLCLDDKELTNETEVTHTFLHNYGANRLILNSDLSSHPLCLSFV